MVKKKMKKNLLKSNSGQILLNVIVILGIIALLSSFIADQSKFTQGMSKRARVRSAMMMAEVKVRNVLLQPSSYDNCDADQKCDLRANVFQYIDPAGLVELKPSNYNYNKSTGEFTAKITPVAEFQGLAMDRNVSLTVDQTTTGPKESRWRCPDETPVFRGYDRNGKPRCEPIWENHCLPGGFVNGMDANVVRESCVAMQLPGQIQCPSDSIMANYEWHGGFDYDTSYNYSCIPRRDPFTFFSFTPDPKIVPPTVTPDNPIPPVANAPNPVTTDLGVPLTPPTPCAVWGQPIAMTGGGCVTPHGGSQPFACSSSDVSSATQIFSCQQCQDVGNTSFYRAVAVRTCGSASGWATLSGTGSTSLPAGVTHHFCCQSAGQVVTDGKELCCMGSSTVRRKYICQPNASGALQLTAPAVGSAEYMDNLTLTQAQDYNVPGCR